MQVLELIEVLNYGSAIALSNAWGKVFGEPLPPDGEEIPDSNVILLAKFLSTPQKGRPGRVTEAAKNLLKSLGQSENLTPESVGFEKVKAKPEKVAALKVEPQPLLFTEITYYAGAENLKPNEVLQKVEPEKVAAEKEKPANFLAQLFERLKKLDELDIVLATSVLIADAGLIYTLGYIGAGWAVVYTCILLHAFKMAGNRKSQVTAQTGIRAVWLLESLSFFIHLAMLNKAIWNAANSGNIPISAQPGDYVPFVIASILAACISAAAVYAVSVRYALMIESIEAEQYELNHNKQY